MSEVKHYGILGMRWGVRRAGPGGRTTVGVGRGVRGAVKEVGGLVKDAIKDDINKASAIASRVRGKPVNESLDSSTARSLKKKNVKELSNKEIQTVITRLNLEKQFNSLNPKQVGFGNKIIGGLINKYGVQILTSFLKNRSQRSTANHTSDPFDNSNAQEGQVIDLKFLKDKN